MQSCPSSADRVRRPFPSPATGATASLGRREQILLALIAALLAVVVFVFQGGLRREAPLERLARLSLDLPVALSDGRPTLVEFYADWCEACRSMAPAMEAIEDHHHGELDVVLLNVDNPRWQGEVERYEVNGIPQLELFDRDGQPIGRSLGARSRGELDALTGALIAQTPCPAWPASAAPAPWPAAAPPRPLPVPAATADCCR
ncbi:thioredoxin domain-containing protein [Cyanobium sp. ATX-6F1]|uniref:thioredoxin domain-containing protein n=1 Tax=Cyanobium sp. ATX-6F1 TaxID=3137388 RepID=UPI0039BE3308